MKDYTALFLSASKLAKCGKILREETSPDCDAYYATFLK
jgi:hypothetical protein